MPINTWRAPCRYCTKPVGARKGFAEKSKTTGHWLVWHGRCEPPPVNKTMADPVIRMPYKDD